MINFITGKNEVTLEFHQHDDAQICLMEMRFYIPATTDGSTEDPVKVCTWATFLTVVILNAVQYNLTELTTKSSAFSVVISTCSEEASVLSV